MNTTDAQDTADETRFPCDNCGSDFRYDPAADNLTCDHCGNTQDISAGPWRGGTLRELDFRSAVAGNMPASEIEETHVVACPNCGAQTEFDETVHATECPFCATPVVTDTGTHRHIKPKGLLPFSFDERTARDKMTDWLGGLWVAPNVRYLCSVLDIRCRYQKQLHWFTRDALLRNENRRAGWKT